MKIAVDAMGGDFAPSVIVEGALLAASELGLSVILVGDKELMEKEAARHKVVKELVSYVYTTEVVAMDESPVKAIRSKKDSSLRVCFELVKKGEAAAVVSAGNSGAALAAGVFLLKRIKGVERPAIAVSMPTKKKPAVLLDVGGNVDCKPSHLCQFAIMGDVYARYALKRTNPTIGLLSNGEEESKGNELTKESNKLLKTMPLNYIGHIEGRDIFKGDVDVIVADGFVGNVVLKLSEGLVEAVTSMLKDEIMESFSSKVGYLLAKNAFKNLKKKIDYAEYGGAPLLGINGVCIISHGRSNAKAIKNAIVRAHESIEAQVSSHLAEEITKSAVQKTKTTSEKSSDLAGAE
jgi:glycerol-3-phosphate acyltransferase PlsX